MSKLHFVTLNHYTPAGFETQDVVLKDDAEKLEQENKRLRASLGRIKAHTNITWINDVCKQALKETT
jgi:hypothetical protein